MIRSTIRRSTVVHRSSNGFTLLELIVTLTIASMAAVWAIPNMQRQFQQKRIDNYTQNLETGLFNLIANVRKSSKFCTLFKSAGIQNNYVATDKLVELASISKSKATPLEQCNLRREYLDCPDGNNICSINPDDFLQFRFLSKEKTKDSKKLEIQTSQTNYQFSPQGTNPKGNDIIFRIRSKEWDKNPGLLTRCIMISGNGQLFKGSWVYSSPNANLNGCQSKCPPNSNCNG